MIRNILIVIVLSFFLAFFPIITIWLYYQFHYGLNPFLGNIIGFIVAITVIAICIFLFRTLKKRSNYKSYLLFIIGFFSYLILLFETQIFYGNTALDLFLDDTYFVMPDFFVLATVSAVFGVFATIYYLFPKVFNKQMNNLLSNIHFWVTFFCIDIVWFINKYLVMSPEKRYYDHVDLHFYTPFNELNRLSVLSLVILIAAQLLFVFNFCYSLFTRKR